MRLRTARLGIDGYAMKVVDVVRDALDPALDIWLGPCRAPCVSNQKSFEST